MKRKNIGLLILLSVGLSTVACKKCVTCDCGAGSTNEELCQSDFDSKEEYDAAVAVVEALGGCNCN